MRGIDLKKIAEKMNGASGAELKVFVSLFAFHLLNFDALQSVVLIMVPV